MVDMMEMIVALAEVGEYREALVGCLSEARLKLLARWTRQIEHTDSQGHLLPAAFTASFYKFVQFLLVKRLVDTDKQVSRLFRAFFLNFENKFSFTNSRTCFSISCWVSVFK